MVVMVMVVLVIVVMVVLAMGVKGVTWIEYGIMDARTLMVLALKGISI
jgi:hypothetical protein